MGRRSLGFNAASERISIRVTRAERKAFAAYAAESDLTVSQIVRMEMIEAIADWEDDKRKDAAELLSDRNPAACSPIRNPAGLSSSKERE